MKKDAYAQRGVSSGKEEVHKAAEVFDKGLFENTFCKILPDVLTGDPDYCLLMHGDGAGTKVILPYLYWKKTGDLKWFRTIVQDALVMNLDDMAAAGVVDNFIINSTIDRNKFNVPGEILQELMQGTQDFLKQMEEFGVTINHSGGETADLGDVVRTFTCNFTVFSRVRRDDIVRINIRPGDHVLGLPSFGSCAYDALNNSGIGANGLTSARHDLLGVEYKDSFPECYDVDNVQKGIIPEELIYCGAHSIESPKIQGLMHPTRTYLPFLKRLKEEGLMQKVSGIIHNTGGGHGKVLKFVDNVVITKNFTTELPEIFALIQGERDDAWEDMFRTFNMGVRMEIYAPADVIDIIRNIANDMDLDPVMHGEVYEAEASSVNITHECIGSMTPVILQ